MHLFKTTLIGACILLATSCSKKDAEISKPGGDNCITSNASFSGEAIPGQYIVLYKPSEENKDATAHRMAQIRSMLLEKNNIAPASVRAIFGGKLAGFVARLNAAEAKKLSEDPAVQVVEQDRVVALSTCFTVVAPTLITWNVTKVGYGNGIGKTVWVIDTGIDMDHPDLTVDAGKSKSFLPNITSPDDENGHGTHVAGIIAAKNNNFGTLGVASGATVVSLRVLDKDGKGTSSAIVQALAHINTYGKPGDVVNLSLGEDVISVAMDQQVQYTASRGILMSIAAGNEGKSANLYSPGRANGDNIFTVSAVDSLDNFASFSNFGNDVVDYAAPGVRILSTYKDGLYAKMSGNSMAAPHVAGLLLLNGRNLHFSTTAMNDPDGTPDRIASK